MINVATVMKYVQREDLKLYKGCTNPIIQAPVTEGFAGHGVDGLGDS